MKNQVIIGLVSLAGLCVAGLGFVDYAQANGWRANSPSEIQIVEGQKEYTMKLGDTLWSIGQKININHVRLAEINNINLNAGEEYRLPVGRVISFEGNVVTVRENDGSVSSQAIIRDSDKIDSSKPAGEAASETEPTTWTMPPEARYSLIDIAGFSAEFVDGLSQEDYEAAVAKANQTLAETGFGDVGALFYALEEMFPGSWPNKPEPEPTTWTLPAEMRDQLITIGGFSADFVDGLSQQDYETAVARAEQKLEETGFGDIGSIFYELEKMFPGSWPNRPTESE